VGAWSDTGALLLALMLFFWTPIHFWALAIVYREDYQRAGVPMLPVTSDPRQAAMWGLVHGIGAALCAVLLAVQPGLGLIYVIPVGAITIVLLWQGANRVRSPVIRPAWRLFHTSNIFLAIVLFAIMASTLITARI
jgi:protoheme IX farnesyltransferase